MGNSATNQFLHEKLIPGAGYYTIESITSDKSSQGGIIYKTDKEEAFYKGKIIKVGADFETEEGAILKPQYKEGDIVLYNFSGFEEILENGDKIRLIRFRAVAAKFI